MKTHRFIITNCALGGAMQIVDREVIHQIRTVLKLKINEKIIVCNGAGSEASGAITEITPDSVSLSMETAHLVAAEPRTRVTMFAAIVKRDNFELIAQKAVEVGACTVVPIITRRTVKTAINRSRLQIIMKEAAEQSGRGIIPIVTDEVELATAIQSASGAKFFCDMGGTPVSDLGPIDSDERSIFVGPEGGWDTAERELAVQQGCQVISFGDLTYRAETAAIIAAHWAVITK